MEDWSEIIGGQIYGQPKTRELGFIRRVTDLEVDADAEALELLAKLEVQLGRHDVDVV